MFIFDAIMHAIHTHAAELSPQESCGLIANGIYFPCRNIAEKPLQDFVISPHDWTAVEDMGEIQAVVHSHPYANPAPSQADLVSLEATGLPWLIINPQTGAHTVTMPSGYRAPLLGREFSYGVLDCYALARDWYAEQGIDLPNVDRHEFGWWDHGKNLFVENFAKAGFESIPIDALRKGDSVLMQVHANVPNHCAVYLGDNIILHHLTHRLSSREVYGGYWLKHTTHALRHREMKPC